MDVDDVDATKRESYCMGLMLSEIFEMCSGCVDISGVWRVCESIPLARCNKWVEVSIRELELHLVLGLCPEFAHTCSCAHHSNEIV